MLTFYSNWLGIQDIYLRTFIKRYSCQRLHKKSQNYHYSNFHISVLILSIEYYEKRKNSLHVRAIQSLS